MSMKEIRRLIEKLENAVSDVEIDIESTVENCENYEFRLSEIAEELELMEQELRLLCRLLYDSNVELPRDGHFMDINPYVPRNDPYKGQYEYG